MVTMIDGPMIMRFIENTQEFNKYIEEKLTIVNHNKHENYSSISLDHQEDKDGDEGFGTVDSEGYRQYFMAVAQGIGNTPVNVLVEEGSFMMKVYEFEVSRIRKEKLEEEKRLKKKIEEEKTNGCLINYVNDNVNGDYNKVNNVVSRKKSLRKKGSFSWLKFCACSGKQFVKD